MMRGGAARPLSVLGTAGIRAERKPRRVVTDTSAPPSDPSAILRSRSFVALLVFAALIGVVVSLASWGYLELIHQCQIGLFNDLPDRLGLDPVPTWWPLPVLGIAGVIVAFAIVRLPGRGGHVPANGLQAGGNEPAVVPGVALASFATLAGGLVLGPEAPLIAIGAGLGRLRRSTREEGRTVASRDGAGRGGKLCGRVRGLRVPDRRCGRRDRGDRPRWRHPPLDSDPWTDRFRDRITHLRGHGELDRVSTPARTRSCRSTSATSRNPRGKRSAGPSSWASPPRS